MGVSIRRRRECSECQTRFTTIERSVLLVVKRNGVTEEFSREKVIKGVRRAAKPRARCGAIGGIVGAHGIYLARYSVWIRYSAVAVRFSCLNRLYPIKGEFLVCVFEKV